MCNTYVHRSKAYASSLSLFLIGGGFGGDILLPAPFYRALGRGIAYNLVNKWPSGIVPYDISPITSKKHASSNFRIESVRYKSYGYYASLPKFHAYDSAAGRKVLRKLSSRFHIDFIATRLEFFLNVIN